MLDGDDSSRHRRRPTWPAKSLLGKIFRCGNFFPVCCGGVRGCHGNGSAHMVQKQVPPPPEGVVGAIAPPHKDKVAMVGCYGRLLW